MLSYAGFVPMPVLAGFYLSDARSLRPGLAFASACLSQCGGSAGGTFETLSATAALSGGPLAGLPAERGF
jgi:hypothetical protein